MLSAKIIFIGAQVINRLSNFVYEPSFRFRPWSFTGVKSALQSFWENVRKPGQGTTYRGVRSLRFDFNWSALGENIVQKVKYALQFLPGGKRLFSGQATSYGQATKKNTLTPLVPLANFSPLSIETTVDRMLQSKAFSIPTLNYEERMDLPSFEIKGGGTRTLMTSSKLGGSTLYNRIDKFLLTCLITLSFTTIPYYSFDYLVNSFLGFTPQDEILNAHSLRVNFPDYTNLLGISLSKKYNVLNTDVSLYDRAHFMYGQWPNSFESLNYQGELMWTNFRDHRRLKRTRRSNRFKFKTLKTKISTSWKEFKRSSGFSGSTIPPQSDIIENEPASQNPEQVREINDDSSNTVPFDDDSSDTVPFDDDSSDTVSFDDDSSIPLNNQCL